MQTIVEKDLPTGFGYDWAGQFAPGNPVGSQTTMLMSRRSSRVPVLAALYETGR